MKKYNKQICLPLFSKGMAVFQVFRPNEFFKASIWTIIKRVAASMKQKT